MTDATQLERAPKEEEEERERGQPWGGEEAEVTSPGAPDKKKTPSVLFDF